MMACVECCVWLRWKGKFNVCVCAFEGEEEGGSAIRIPSVMGDSLCHLLLKILGRVLVAVDLVIPCHGLFQCHTVNVTQPVNVDQWRVCFRHTRFKCQLATTLWPCTFCIQPSAAKATATEVGNQASCNRRTLKSVSPCLLISCWINKKSP